MSGFDLSFVLVVVAAFTFYALVLAWGINRTAKLFDPWH